MSREEKIFYNDCIDKNQREINALNAEKNNLENNIIPNIIIKHSKWVNIYFIYQKSVYPILSKFKYIIINVRPYEVRKTPAAKKKNFFILITSLNYIYLLIKIVYN